MLDKLIFLIANMLSVCYVHCYEVKVHFYHTFANLTRALVTRQLIRGILKLDFVFFRKIAYLLFFFAYLQEALMFLLLFFLTISIVACCRLKYDCSSHLSSMLTSTCLYLHTLFSGCFSDVGFLCCVFLVRCHNPRK